MIESVNIQPSTKLPQRQFLPLFLLGMLLVTLLLIGQWLWLTQTLNIPAAPILLPSERSPLFDSLFRQKTIVWSLSASAIALLLAILVGVSPLSWWLPVRSRFGKGGKRSGVRPDRLALWGQAPQSAEEWVAAQTALSGVPQTAVAPSCQAGSPASGQAAATMPPTQGQPPLGPPGVPGQPPVSQQPGVLPAPGQQPTAQQPAPPGAQQPGAPPQQPGIPSMPGQPQQPGAPPTPGQPEQPADAQQPGAPQPQSQPAAAAQPPEPGLQQLLATEENVDIKELTDIGDILSSFKDNEDVPAHLLALSQSLDEVAVETLVAHSKSVAARLKAANFPGRRPAGVKKT